MNSLLYGMNTHVIPVVAPIDLGAATIRTTHVKVSHALAVTYLINFGVITNDTMNITVEESTSAATTGAEAIGFGYRLTGDTAADTYAAVTTCDSAGTSFVHSAINNISMWLEVDLTTLSDDCNYLCVKIVAGSDPSLMSVTALLRNRYGQYDPVSTT
jgi:hypothetical protein